MINGMKPNYIKQKEFKDALTVFCDKLTLDGKEHIKRYTHMTNVVFRPDGGRKYIKIKYWETTTSSNSQFENDRDGRIHCFVEAETGNIFKPAGWKGPYLKGENAVRANIFDETTFEKTDMHGGWLYL